MLHTRHVLLSSLVVVPLLGCQGQAGPISAEFERLNNEIQTLKFELAAIQKRVHELPIASASVSTEEVTFGVAHTTFGALTVSAESTKPHLDGYMVTLSIGSPMAADFPDGKVKVSWGTKYLDRKEREVSLTKPIRAGSYTTVEVALTPASAEEVKRLYVNLGLNAISLRSR